jgi:hypothetical protein
VVLLRRTIRVGFLVATALCMTVFMSSMAFAIVGDGTDPNDTIDSGSTQVCSATAITPEGYNYTHSLDGFGYELRYSTDCRSVWERSRNDAPHRNGMVSYRWTSPTYCTNSIRFVGSTYEWTAEVNDADEQVNVRLMKAGYSGDCVATHAFWISNSY